MPRLFLVKRHQVKILLTGFSVLLIAVPLFFYLNLSDSLNKDDNGVNNKNRQLFGSELDSDVSFDDIPMILFKSVELQSITPKSSHLTLLKRLNEDLQS
jgi:preprotein translocase subunit Sec63